MTSATSMPMTVTIRTETPKLSPSRTNPAVPKAPMPASANWPSESCPAQPVSTVSDNVMSA